MINGILPWGKNKRWGMTLAGNLGGSDWQLEKFNQNSPVKGNFITCYGVDNTGNVYKTENLKDFQKIVLKGTNGAGVHLFTADGVRPSPPFLILSSLLSLSPPSSLCTSSPLPLHGLFVPFYFPFLPSLSPLFLPLPFSIHFISLSLPSFLSPFVFPLIEATKYPGHSSNGALEHITLLSR